MSGLMGSGASKARKEAQRQHDAMMKQSREAEAQRQAQENVAQAQAKLAEDSMFAPEEDEVEVQAGDAKDVGGARKRKRRQDTSGGLGIG